MPLPPRTLPCLLAVCLAATATASTATLEDAALWLSRYGVDVHLPRLPVYYGHADVQGSGTTFRLSSDETSALLANPPSIEWETVGDTDKYMLLMLDPDHPERAADGSNSGAEGPFLHWLVVNMRESAAGGITAMAYKAPSADNGPGTHRYVFLLLEQRGVGTLAGYSDSRGPNWDLAGFLKDNAHAVRPVAYNFFYATAESIGSALDGAAARAAQGLPSPEKSEL